MCLHTRIHATALVIACIHILHTIIPHNAGSSVTVAPPTVVVGVRVAHVAPAVPVRVGLVGVGVGGTVVARVAVVVGVGRLTPGRVSVQLVSVGDQGTVVL